MISVSASLPGRALRRGRGEIARWRQRRADRGRSTHMSDAAFAAALGIADRRDFGTGPGFERLVDLSEVKGLLRGTLASSLLAIESCARRAREHEFDLLGSGPVRPDYGFVASGFLGHRFEPSSGPSAQAHRTAMRDALSAAAAYVRDDSPGLQSLTDAISDYAPIDWHVDVRSGYRWDPTTWYMDVPHGHLRGVDIKLPWELSRFHHLPSLAMQCLAGDNPTAGREVSLQLLDWIVANPPRYGVNWRSSMDAGIRAANWVWGLALLPPDALPPAMHWLIAKSMYQHGRHVHGHLDNRPPHTNHYLAEVVGLMYVAFAYPVFPESKNWMAFALRELAREMDRTVYEDGVSYEGSTGYHRLVTEMFLHGSLLGLRLTPERRLPLRAAGAARATASDPHVFPQWYWQRLRSMVDYTADITKPTGLAPQWGDQDSGRFVKFIPVFRATENGPSGEEPSDHRHLLDLGSAVFGGGCQGRNDSASSEVEAALLTCGVAGLPLEGGPANAIVVRSGSPAEGLICYPRGGAVILRRGAIWAGLRAEPAGLGGPGGHEHNDRLAVELNVAGLDFITDWGTGVYTADVALRNRFRSTANHSTIAVDGVEQREWKEGLLGLFSFRTPIRAAVTEVTAHAATMRHDAYGSPHVRTVRIGEGSIDITDELDVERPSLAVFTLAPEVSAALEPDGSVSLERAGVRLLVESVERRPIEIEEGCCSLAYGTLVSSWKLVIRRLSALERTRITLKSVAN